MMIDESKAIKAKQIVDEPDAIFALNRAYIMIMDTSMTMSFNNLMDAINIMNDAGWSVESMANYSSYMFVLMKNSNYKKKNSGE